MARWWGSHREEQSPYSRPTTTPTHLDTLSHTMNMRSSWVAFLVVGLVAACGSSEDNLFNSSSSGQGGQGATASGTAGTGGLPCGADCSQMPTPPCQVAVCNEQIGQCEVVHSGDGSVCDDADPCTFGETCQSGTCVGGTQVTTCEQSGDGCCPPNCSTTDFQTLGYWPQIPRDTPWIQVNIAVQSGDIIGILGVRSGTANSLGDALTYNTTIFGQPTTLVSLRFDGHLAADQAGPVSNAETSYNYGRIQMRYGPCAVQP